MTNNNKCCSCGRKLKKYEKGICSNCKNIFEDGLFRPDFDPDECYELPVEIRNKLKWRLEHDDYYFMEDLMYGFEQGLPGIEEGRCDPEDDIPIFPSNKNKW